MVVIFGNNRAIGDEVKMVCKSLEMQLVVDVESWLEDLQRIWPDAARVGAFD